jgi:class 3 adenylate cyclase
MVTVLMPAITAFYALDYFSIKYKEYNQEKATLDYCQKLDLINNSLRPEVYLKNSIPLLRKHLLKTNKVVNISIFNLVKQNIGSEPIMAVLKHSGSRKITAVKNEKVTNKTLPPGILFRRIFKQLQNPNTPKRKRTDNKRLFQQLFKTITPVTIARNHVAKNYSIYFGGEIYFVFAQLPSNKTFSHVILIFRGSDIGSQVIVNHAKLKNIDYRIVLRPVTTSYKDNSSIKFNSKIESNQKGIVIEKPANQHFTRHFLHEGKIKIKRSLKKIPFLQLFVPDKQFEFAREINLSLWRKFFVLIIFLSFALLIRACLFGFEFSGSIKNLVIATVIAVAIFPFTVMTISLYLYQTFDKAISRISLIKNIELKMAQNFEKLQHQVHEYETYLISRPVLCNKLIKINKNDFENFVDKLAKKLPFSIAAYFTRKKSYQKVIEERQTGFSPSKDDPVWSFVPKSMLKWLDQDGTKNRKPQHYFYVANQRIKNSSIIDAVQSVGGFYLLSQGNTSFWVSSVKIYDKSLSPPKVMAIFNLKYDLPPLLKTFYAENYANKNDFSYIYQQNKINFAFFPLKDDLNKNIWSQSCDPDKVHLFEPYGNLSQSQIIQDNNNKVVVIKKYSGFPHKAIAVAFAQQNDKITGIYYFIAASFGFMLTLLFFVAQLLNRFLSEPVAEMARNAAQVARGKEVWDCKVQSGDELEILNTNFVEMIEGLKQRNLLKNYVSTDALNEIEKNKNLQLFPGGEYLEATILFVSLTNNLIQEETEASAIRTIDHLNNFLTNCDSVCKKYQGTIDKIIENTILIVFRKNQTENHSLNAVKTCLELKNNLETDHNSLLAGIASGKIISGKIGSYKGKLDYTVIGDTVNLAARLKNEAENSNTGIIISGSTMRYLKGKVRVKFIRRTSIKGKSRHFNIYEVTGLRNSG